MAKRLLVICHLSSFILLPACGFEPMHGGRPSAAHASAGHLSARIAVTASAQDQERRRMAQLFRDALQDLLNPAGGVLPPEYRLDAALAMSEVPVSIARDGTVSRYNVQIDASLVLTRVSDGALVYTGQARRTGSYNNVSNAFYSTYASSEDTVNRTAQELAEDIRIRMAAFFAQHPAPAPLPALDMKRLPENAPPAAPVPLRPGEL